MRLSNTTSTPPLFFPTTRQVLLENKNYGRYHEGCIMNFDFKLQFMHGYKGLKSCSQGDMCFSVLLWIPFGLWTHNEHLF